MKNKIQINRIFYTRQLFDNEEQEKQVFWF